jgi:hypothetical protein
MDAGRITQQMTMVMRMAMPQRPSGRGAGIALSHYHHGASANRSVRGRNLQKA